MKFTNPIHRLRIEKHILFYYWVVGTTPTFGVYFGDFAWFRYDIFHNAAGVNIRFWRASLWVTLKPMAWWLTGIKRYINLTYW